MDNIQTQTNVRSGSIEAKDPFAQSIPGTSLTSENKKWAWGNPPENSDPDVVLQEATDRFEKDDGGMNKDRIDDESLFTLMKNNNPAMFETLREELNSTIRKGK